MAVGVVAYAGYARHAVDLTPDIDSVRRFLTRFEFGATTVPRDTAKVTLDMLTAGRSSAPEGVGIPDELVVFFGAHKNFAGNDFGDLFPIFARGIYEAGVDLRVVCMASKAGSHFRCVQVELMADVPSVYLGRLEERRLPGRLAEWLADRAADAPVPATLELSHTLPAGLELVPDPALPPPDVVATGAEQTLRWRWDAPAISTTHTVRFAVQADRPLRAVITGRAAVTDSHGVARIQALAPITVTAAGGCITPSPTVPTPTSSPTPTLTPAPTGTRVPAPVYLPLALREHCTPDDRHADVVLVMDASTSMLDPVPSGGTKIDAARAAAEALLALLRFPADQAAVVSFDETARLEQPLTGDAAAVRAALARITHRPFTRIDLGVAEARRELASARHDGDQTAVLVLLTDGRANPVGPEAAVAEAAGAKAEGALVFTIGLGADLDADALVAMASRPAWAYRAPDASDLAAIYERIGGEIPCPAGAFWGKR